MTRNENNKKMMKKYYPLPLKLKCIEEEEETKKEVLQFYTIGNTFIVLDNWIESHSNWNPIKN
jgi:hypothetical protein